MERIKTAVAIFCIACICAELVAQLVGDTRGKQCIKAAAGLYILIAISNALPSITPQKLSLALPQAEQADFGAAEDAILQQAQQQLEEKMEEELLTQTGVVLDIQISLCQTEEGVQVTEGRAVLPEGCSAEIYRIVEEKMNQSLGLETVEFEVQGEET